MLHDFKVLHETAQSNTPNDRKLFPDENYVIDDVCQKDISDVRPSVRPSVRPATQDTRPHEVNRTLIVDNAGRRVTGALAVVATWDAAQLDSRDASRTWLAEGAAHNLDEVHVTGAAQLALSPTLGRSVGRLTSPSPPSSAGQWGG